MGCCYVWVCCVACDVVDFVWMGCWSVGVCLFKSWWFWLIWMVVVLGIGSVLGLWFGGVLICVLVRFVVGMVYIGTYLGCYLVFVCCLLISAYC